MDILWVLICVYRVFFLFWLIWHAHNLVIFWAKIKFLDIFHIYIPFIFCKKKFWEKFFKPLNFIAVFVKVVILRNNGKILFLKFSKILNFQIFTNFDAKSIFLIVFVYISMFVLIKALFLHFWFKLPKIEKFCQKSENFGNFTKIGTFSKNNIKK